MTKSYFIYILTNENNTVLYTGITNDLKIRIQEHRLKTSPGFSGKSNINKLVYYEKTDDIYMAILRQKQIQIVSEQRKVDLINTINKEWRDLYNEL